MRHRDPRDDPPPKRRRQACQGPPVTMGHIRSHGVRQLLIYCSTGFCHHCAVVDADRRPDDTVLLDLDWRAVCTKCGVIRRRRPAELERATPPEGQTGVQWRQR
jgi:hypothetical protein